jgi:CubicO group peptidase (beta-lactamase class C family)
MTVLPILLGTAWIALAISPSSAQHPPHHGVDLTVTQPEAVGFSSERIELLHTLMQHSVDQKQIAGAVTILARHGKVIDYRAYGQRDMDNGSPMSTDVIFRDFSMTKPVTGVAMMILYEQGKWLPSDPIAKHIPEFAHLKVFKGVDAGGKMLLQDPEHAPTMRELMTHTAGFTYGIIGKTPVDAMYRDSKVLQSKNLQEMIDKLARIPLLY